MALTVGMRTSARERAPERIGRFIPPSGGRRHAHARRLDDAVRGADASVPGVPRSHRLAASPGAPLPPAAALRPLRPGPPRVGRRPAPEPRLPRPPYLPAGPRQRAAAAPSGRADLLPAARPLEASVGAVAGRGP